MSLKRLVLIQTTLYMITYTFLSYAGVRNFDYYFLTFTIIYLITTTMITPLNGRLRIINNIILGILIITSLIIIALKVITVVPVR